MARKKTKKKKRKRKTRKKQKKTKQKITILVLSIVMIALILSLVFTILISLSLFPVSVVEEEPQKIEFMIKKPLLNSTQAVTYLPAVDKEGNGVMTVLVVEAVPGSGRTLVDIDNLLFWADTQHSIRIAKNVASEITEEDINNYDFVYNIYANASVIGRESAGAAITIATISILENKELRDDVVITGTVNHDGTIGPVSAILPKAKISGDAGAKIFLVPLLQGQEIIYETREHCEKFGPNEFCTTEQVPRKVNISEEAGIEVIEVGTIEEALEYFFEK
ncbi:MAG: hypothetical protein IB618_00465 [Candidatus Pacearchaeota archaeon]|nr:MAG: hypothetical protein IB618_00465 [Candidatus Pacearchaeota archaeon]